MRRKYKPRETIQSLSRKVNNAIEATLDSQRFKEYITTMARFHSYSFHNQMLITLQKPDATRVAGYVAWKTKFNRNVKRGAQSIAIFGHPKTVAKELELEDGTLDTEERTWWPIVHVFDISDTEGDALPDLDRTRIPDNSPQAFQLLGRLIGTVRAHGIKYVEVDKVGGTLTNSNALGSYSPEENSVQLVTGNGTSRGELFKTLAHEFGHALFRDRTHESHSYSFEECVVETSAMIVASRFGLDLAPYDVSYVVGWSKGDRTLYRSGLEKATSIASIIITKLEEEEDELDQ